MLQQHPSKVIATLLRSDVDRVPPLVAHMHRAVGINGAILGAKVALGCLGISLWRRGGWGRKCTLGCPKWLALVSNYKHEMFIPFCAEGCTTPLLLLTSQ